MPFPLKIQPIDSDSDSVSNTPDGSFRNDPVSKPVAKSRFKRLFERQFQSVLRINSSSEKVVEQQQQHHNKDDILEPSSVCLAKMVQSFIEDSNEKPCGGKKRCNCFNGNCNDSSDDELDFFGGSFADSIGSVPCTDTCDCDCLKNLISCANSQERTIHAEVTKLVENHKICREAVSDGLICLGYNASVCKSRWEKSPSYPAGEYEYIDVIVEGERLIIDVDFRSEFEIARSTKNYRNVLQFLPVIFVGKPDRLQQIVSIVSEGAKQSLKKKGMHLPPWRKAEYMRAKWFSPYTRTTTSPSPPLPPPPPPVEINTEKSASSPTSVTSITNISGELNLIFGEENNKSSLNSPAGSESESESESGEAIPIPIPIPIPANSGQEEEEKISVVVSPWQPPAIKPRSLQRGGKIVTGLASILKEKP